MKSEFKAKLLQHLVNSKEEKGFTLIELLVVIIIIGILAAIALPSFLNQANKAKQSEARTYIGSMNRAQQAYYLEKDEFIVTSADIGGLGLGIATETATYKYDVVTGGKEPAAVKNFSLTIKDTAPVKNYTGGVSLGSVAATSEATTLATLCESNKVAALDATARAVDAMTFSKTAAPKCSANYTALGSK